MSSLVRTAAGAVLGAAAAAAGLGLGPRPGGGGRPSHPLRGGRHVRPNYRGRPVWATGGLVLLPPLGIGTLAAAWRGAARTGVIMAVAGGAFAALGLLDDLYGDRHAGGLLGHLRALARGRMTTGTLKALGGTAAGLGTAAALGWRGWWVVAAGAVVALAANAANLLDVRPARTAKAWGAGALTLIALGVGGGGALVLWALVGGVAVVARAELREEVMLGDTGSNLLGALLGTAVAARLSEAALLATLGALAGVTGLAEARSLSALIERVGPLRWLDRLGRDGLGSGP